MDDINEDEWEVMFDHDIRGIRSQLLHDVLIWRRWRYRYFENGELKKDITLYDSSSVTKFESSR